MVSPSIVSPSRFLPVVHPFPDGEQMSFIDGHTEGQTERTDPGLGRVADDESRAACVPLRAERRPRQLLALGQPAVQLCSCLGDCIQQFTVSPLHPPSSYVARRVSSFHIESSTSWRHPDRWRVTTNSGGSGNSRLERRTLGRICDSYQSKSQSVRK